MIESICWTCTYESSVPACFTFYTEDWLNKSLIFGLLVRVFVGVWGFVLFLFGFLDLVRTNCLIRTAVGAAISGTISIKS